MENIKKVFYCILFFCLSISFSCDKMSKTGLNKNYSKDKLDITYIEASLEKLTENQFLYLKVKDSIDKTSNKSIFLYELLDYEYPMPSKNYLELCLIKSDNVLLNNSKYDENNFNDDFLNSFKESINNDMIFKSHVLINLDVNKLKDDLALRKKLENLLNISLTNFDSIREKYSIKKYGKSFNHIEYNKKIEIIKLVPLSIYLGNNSDCNRVIPPPPIQDNVP
ncbi:hypothetical protein [Flavobacterium sp.]|uniref:hypothetical protein n=1 Tax=Flavobacterium sp. TaxID=239 RepID=UPI0025BDCBF7|nr:hypothetical protein [Flavobacterium sp.]